jgi:hypothetical protein
MDDFHSGVGLAEPSEQLPHAVEFELSLLIGNEGGPLEVDAAQEPVNGDLASRVGDLRSDRDGCAMLVH